MSSCSAPAADAGGRGRIFIAPLASQIVLLRGFALAGLPVLRAKAGGNPVADALHALELGVGDAAPRIGLLQVQGGHQQAPPHAREDVLVDLHRVARLGGRGGGAVDGG
eukprot:CAMPEP_0118930288 /NCGR_PEP_ID=MMETSP1169-20130426/7026_1 /TAXON_ID=36882 /ORGANISM="Pyramimonas obovata, Strain CCMP722" /LENGTH=108 /DNA_ID=CAMNT_0006872615 /DNA_START=268 /DNA_END=591 /DNA_ORIENTATION=-